MRSINNLIKLTLLTATIFLIGSCTTQHKIQTFSNNLLIRDTGLLQSHVGIALYDPSTRKNLYTFQSDKLFTPASNTKILSCYAAMKYLPNLLPAAYITDLDTAVVITPTGDPSFLQPDFNTHPLFDKLKSINKPLYIINNNWKSPALGLGWSWDDYSEYYMTERSAFPVYGNQIHWYQEKTKKENPSYVGDTVDLFIYSNPEVNWPVKFGTGTRNKFYVERDRDENAFTLYEGKEKSAVESVPFITKGIETGIGLLNDSLGKEIHLADEAIAKLAAKSKADTIFSQPTDSLLKIMMHRSDNFYADQCLEMVSQQRFQKMDEEGLIKEMLDNELAGFPQKPTWVDGSGLSRYTLFSPNDMIYILDKIRNEQPFERIKTIFSKVANGSSDQTNNNLDFVYAKSGSMGGVLCLSGYVYTQKKKWLIFSVMINNTQTSFSYLRKQINKYLVEVSKSY